MDKAAARSAMTNFVQQPFSKIYLTFCHFALDFLLFTVYIQYRFWLALISIEC